MSSCRCSFYSKSLKMTAWFNLIIPEDTNDVTPLFQGDKKLVTLLHGIDGNCEEWIRYTKLEYYVKKYHCMIVLPEGNRSFYVDSRKGNYMQYLHEDLPSFLNTYFQVPQKKIFILPVQVWEDMAVRYRLFNIPIIIKVLVC